MNFPSQIFFNNINHGYRAAILTKNYLWLLPFFIAVATSCYYLKVRRTMRTPIVSYLLNSTWKCIQQKWICNNKRIDKIPVLKNIQPHKNIRFNLWNPFDTWKLFKLSKAFNTFNQLKALTPLKTFNLKRSLKILEP